MFDTSIADRQAGQALHRSVRGSSEHFGELVTHVYQHELLEVTVGLPGAVPVHLPVVSQRQGDSDHA
jgi:hypothetical protein